MITNLDQIVTRVKEKGAKRLSVACGEDPHTIEAVFKAVKEGVVTASLTGDKESILKVAEECKVDTSLFEIEDISDKNTALERAVEKVASGEADFLMKGLIDSSAYIRAILKEGKKRSSKDQIISHVSLISLPTYHKLLVVSDIAVIPSPDLKQKIAITNYAIETAHVLGIEKPKVSIISAVEKVQPKMQSTVDAAILSKMGDRGQIKGAIIDGPLSLDVSVSKESTKIKGVKSEVAGDADILIFPNIETGNVFFKTCTQLASGNVGAILTGAFCPCILTSRSDSEVSKFYSIALGALMANG